VFNLCLVCFVFLKMAEECDFCDRVLKMSSGLRCHQRSLSTVQRTTVWLPSGSGVRPESERGPTATIGEMESVDRHQFRRWSCRRYFAGRQKFQGPASVTVVTAGHVRDRRTWQRLRAARDWIAYGVCMRVCGGLAWSGRTLGGVTGQ